MNRLLTWLCAACVLLTGCSWDSGDQETAPGPSSDTNDITTVLGKIIDGIDRLGQKAAERGWIDTTEVRETVPEEVPEEEREPARELKWYEKDYSITVQDLDEKVTYTYTRKGNRMTIEGKGGGKTQKEDMEILDNGGVRSKVYHNGQYIRTYTLEKTPEEVLKLYLGSSKTNMRVIGSYPIPVATSKNDTRCGRSCWVVSKVTEEALLGYNTRKEDVYYVDKEYGFIYEKVSSASGNVGVSYQGKTHFRVTAFTDKP